MDNREVIRDFYGKSLGSITTDLKGNKVVRDFHGRLLGRYDARNNVTRDFYGKIIARGDQCSALIFNATRKR